MASAHHKQQVIGILQEGTTFEGNLSFVGTLKIGGNFKGEIISNDTLIVDETARIEGQIKVGEIIIKGEVQGTVLASEKVTMLAPAKFKGSVSSPNLKIEEGVLFDGASIPMVQA